MVIGMEWQEIAGNWILVPRSPVAIVHFLGGAFVAAAPQLTYRWLLEQLAKQRYIIIATPFDSAFDRSAFDHSAIARSTLLRLESALDYLYQRQLATPELPIYGLGHSLGCKLHLLNSSIFEAQRAGNILMAFNNYPAKRAIPFYEQVSQASSLFDNAVTGAKQFLDQGKNSSSSMPAFLNRIADKVAQAVPEDVSQTLSQQSQQFSQQVSQVIPDLKAEFQPSPTETQQVIADSYGVRRNLLIQFTTDNIDQTDDLYQTLMGRFPDAIALHRLSGNHLTPIGQDVEWSAGADFSPIDAVGQFVKQGAYHDLNQLRRTMLEWLGEG